MLMQYIAVMGQQYGCFGIKWKYWKPEIVKYFFENDLITLLFIKISYSSTPVSLLLTITSCARQCGTTKDDVIGVCAP